MTIFARRPQCLEQGLTIVESMMALTVASAIVAAIAPLILISVSTRLYNYKTEQAAQLAQGQINRVQTLMTQGVPQANELGRIPPAAASGVIVSQVAAPTATVSSMTDLDVPSKALEVDTNNDGRPDYLVQMFRDQGMRFDQGVASNQLAIFQMGVRVYSGLAKDNLGRLSTNLAPINLIQGFGQQSTRPLAVFYTEVSRSDLKLSLQLYRAYVCSQTPRPSGCT